MIVETALRTREERLAEYANGIEVLVEEEKEAGRVEGVGEKAVEVDDREREEEHRDARRGEGKIDRNRQRSPRSSATRRRATNVVYDTRTTSREQVSHARYDATRRRDGHARRSFARAGFLFSRRLRERPLDAEGGPW